MANKAETAIVEEIIDFIKSQSGDAWHVHGSSMQRKGEPDIDGWMPIEGTDKFIHLKVEVKTEDGEIEPLQQERLDVYAHAKYVTGVVRSLAEFKALIAVYGIVAQEVKAEQESRAYFQGRGLGGSGNPDKEAERQGVRYVHKPATLKRHSASICDSPLGVATSNAILDDADARRRTYTRAASEDFEPQFTNLIGRVGVTHDYDHLFGGLGGVALITLVGRMRGMTEPQYERFEVRFDISRNTVIDNNLICRWVTDHLERTSHRIDRRRTISIEVERVHLILPRGATPDIRVT